MDKARHMIRNTILTHCFRHKVSNEFNIGDLAKAWAEYGKEHNLPEPSNMSPLTVTLLLRGFLERMEEKNEVEFRKDEFQRVTYVKVHDYTPENKS